MNEVENESCRLTFGVVLSIVTTTALMYLTAYTALVTNDISMFLFFSITAIIGVVWSYQTVTQFQRMTGGVFPKNPGKDHFNYTVWKSMWWRFTKGVTVFVVLGSLSLNGRSNPICIIVAFSIAYVILEEADVSASILREHWNTHAPTKAKST